MNDGRDPTALGLTLLNEVNRQKAPASVVADREAARLARVPDYRDETTIEKYGDPRLLPSTMP